MLSSDAGSDCKVERWKCIEELGQEKLSVNYGLSQG